METQETTGVADDWVQITGSTAAGLVQFQGFGLYAESATTPTVTGHSINSGDAFPKQSAIQAWAKAKFPSTTLTVVFTPN